MEESYATEGGTYVGNTVLVLVLVQVPGTVDYFVGTCTGVSGKLRWSINNSHVGF